MKQKMKTKILTLLNAILVLFIISGGTFLAYWAFQTKGADKNNNNDITVGEGDVVLTEILLNSDQTEGNLVPVGRKSKDTDVEEITITYNVTWTATNDLGHDKVESILTVNVSASEELINLEYTKTHSVVLEDTIQVIIKITLTEPKDKNEYDRLMANRDITINVSFIVASVE